MGSRGHRSRKAIDLSKREVGGIFDFKNTSSLMKTLGNSSFLSIVVPMKRDSVVSGFCDRKLVIMSSNAQLVLPLSAGTRMSSESEDTQLFRRGVRFDDLFFLGMAAA